MSNPIKILLVAVVLVAVGAGAVFVILPDSADAAGPDAALTSGAQSPSSPTFARNLAGAPAGNAKVIEEMPADVPDTEESAPAVADSADRRDKRTGKPVVLTGRVLDTSGRPVEGATVSFVREPMALMASRVVSDEDATDLPDDLLVKTVTDREGHFALTGRTGRQAKDNSGGFLRMSREPELVVQHPSFATLLHPCTTLEPGSWDAGDLVLDSGAWIVGRVVDGSGRAVADAAISATNTGDSGGRRGMRIFGPGMFGGLAQQLDSVVSGPDGRFTVRGLMPGLAHVTASKQGLRLGSVEDVKLEALVPADVGNIVLEAGVAIAGVVVDEHGAPLVGASVSVSSMARLMVNRIEDLPRGQLGQEMGQRAETDDTGRFELGGLVGGTYNVHVNADGYAMLTQADVPAGTRNLRLSPQRLGGLLVTLVSARDGVPVDEARIAATSAAGFGRWSGPGVDSPVLEGAAALAAAGKDGDPAGMYFVQQAGLDGTDLVVAAEGFATAKADGPAVPSGGIGTLVVQMQPESVVAGYVLDASGAAIERARVTLRAVQPESDGEFDFGRRSMRFSREIRIGADDEEEAPPDAEQMRERTGHDGSFEIRGAAAGEWELTASADGYASSKPMSITLADGQEQRDLKVELVRAGSIAGFVTEVDGTPVDDARVEVAASSVAAAQANNPATDMRERLDRIMGGMGGGRGAGPWRAHTDATGHYEVTGLAPGRYDVRLDPGPGGHGMRGMMVMITGDDQPDEPPAASTTVVEGVESRVDIVRPKRSIVRGRVTAGGQAAADVTVRLRTDSPFAFGGEGAQTDAFGEYEFKDVEAGDYVVTCLVPGAAIEERAQVKVEAGQTVGADLVFGGATLSGRVVDASSGFGLPGVALNAAPSRPEPAAAGSLAGASVAFEIVTQDDRGGGPQGMSISVGGGPVSMVQTDASGNFELKYLKPGKYSVEASGGGYTTSSIGPFDVSDGQDKDDLLIKVQRGATVDGLVHSGETGGRLDKVPVRLSGDDTRDMTVTEDGAYHFEGLEPGDYTVEVLGSGWGADAIASEDITLEEGEARKLDLVTGD